MQEKNGWSWLASSTSKRPFPRTRIPVPVSVRRHLLAPRLLTCIYNIYIYIVTSQLRTTAPRDCHCSAQLRPPIKGLPSRATASRYVYTGPGGVSSLATGAPGTPCLISENTKVEVLHLFRCSTHMPRCRGAFKAPTNEMKVKMREMEMKWRWRWNDNYLTGTQEGERKKEKGRRKHQHQHT